MDPVEILEKAREYRANAERCMKHAATGINTGWWTMMADRWLHMARTEEVMASQYMYLEGGK